VNVRDLQSARQSAVRDALRLPRDAARLRAEIQSVNRAIVNVVESGTEKRSSDEPTSALVRT
jgi:hypothetical protein